MLITNALRNKNKRIKRQKDGTIVQDKSIDQSARTELVKQSSTLLDNNENSHFERKIYPSLSIRNLFIVDILKRKKKLRLKKLIEYRKKHKATSNQNESKVEESNVNYDPPEGAHNRVGRWTNTELTKLKLAMQIFGD